ncbi:RNA-binding S4 domain-containing protein [Pseudomarimonas arenosa]|uniref:Heat shock protein 15 n=1 Tax=Pseudomarimonas arenosa TaxID=2774145 RepID=A0AAW3ZNI1_9GAMM|nr:S4 domain-containing protein [Pseudomarimonas arenosa]MBD8526192.1 RNA-binding protein [Pseudomarimonas arenosa]
MSAGETASSVRIDLWLWAARFFKTRSLAKEAVAHSKIKLGDQTVSKPARAVRVGDRLQIERGGELYEVEVRGLSEQRGPASVAQSLYFEDEASAKRRAELRETRKLQNAGFQPPDHRPDKRDRRKLNQLKSRNNKPDDGLPPWFPR